MRVLILCYFMNNGGAERVAATWANGLAALGHDLAVYCDFSEPQTYTLDQAVRKISSPHWKASSKWQKLTRSLRTAASLLHAVRDFKPDVIISVMHSFTRELLLVRPLLPPFKFLSTEHSSFERPSSAPFTSYEHYKKYSLNKRYDAVTVLTAPDKALAEAAGVRNVEVLHNPLFATPLDHIPDKEKVVLAVGRINEWHVKGFDVLIKAWRKIADRHSDWHLRIVGSSDTKSLDYMHSLAEGCRGIEFKDYTTDILDEYRRAAIFCLSSRYEGWGLVLVEAMSQRCACVACDYKGRQAEIITDGVDGLLCVHDDVDALAAKLDLLISDDNKRQELQQGSANNLGQYSPDKITLQLQSILDTILPRSGRRQV